MNARYIAAIDLGASSGRVMLASFTPASNAQPAQLQLCEIHRFTNQLKKIEGHDTWDVDYLEQQILCGLQKIDAQNITLDSIGIDTWGVDFVLLDECGQRIGLPVAYRDSRTEGVMPRVLHDLGQAKLYHKTGIQFLPFNTLYQLKALQEQHPQWLENVAYLLLIPDYFHFRLTGVLNWEYTNASTTQLLDLHTRQWDDALLDYLQIPRHWLGKTSQPGRLIGHWKSPRGQQIPVVSVATHDTASAVVAAPMTSPYSAYLSSGTWSLMGLESEHPYTHAEALDANITNEGGINGRYRVLKNIMGLWLIQRLCQELAIDDLPQLVAQAAQLPGFVSLINPNEPCFINPDSMVEAIRQACQQHQQPIPATPAALARCVFDSLAMLYRQVSLQLAELQQAPIHEIHIVGGGCQNDLLNQLCADVCQLPVTAGPVEASTLGNIGCQLMALGEVSDVSAYRHILAHSHSLKHYTPRYQPELSVHWQRFQAISYANEELVV
jgi:rhamnulokinase